MSLHIVILAAGLGKRMLSNRPKVLHALAGKPLLGWVLDVAFSLSPSKVHVIYGHQGARVQAEFQDYEVNWVYQAEQLGTGHAVAQALPAISEDANVLILSADVPLIASKTLQALIAKQEAFQEAVLALLVAKVQNPRGLGRIVRNDKGTISAIVEEKDATEQEKNISEIYSGICFVKAAALKNWLPKLKTNNAQGEYYITDIIAMAVAEGGGIVSSEAQDEAEVQGVNDLLQLQTLERIVQCRLAEALMLEQGVTFSDASRVDIRGSVVAGRDVTMDVNVVLEGQVTLGDGCFIGPQVFLKNVVLDANVVVHANSVLEGCHIGPETHIGPFARIRSGTVLARGCKIGNFVETKAASFGEGSKASHLSYLGDVTIGKAVNIGAGTITCNYDGVNKHATIIEDGVLVGSDTQLVAPVRVGTNATIGAGSTIRKDVPKEALTLTVSEQKTVYGWERPIKKQKDKV